MGSLRWNKIEVYFKHLPWENRDCEREYETIDEDSEEFVDEKLEDRGREGGLGASPGLDIPGGGAVVCLEIDDSCIERLTASTLTCSGPESDSDSR